MAQVHFGWSDPRVPLARARVKADEASKAIWNPGAFIEPTTEGSVMTSPSRTTLDEAVDKALVQIDLFFDNPFEQAIQLDYVGSRVTCVPAPTDTDEDILILTDNITDFVKNCLKVGFSHDGSYVGSEFVSLKQGEVNLIITDNRGYYEKFMLATHVCKSLNVLDKQHRITVFQSILYGKAYGKP